MTSEYTIEIDGSTIVTGDAWVAERASRRGATVTATVSGTGEYS